MPDQRANRADDTNNAVRKNDQNDIGGQGVASGAVDAVAAWAFAQSSLRRIELTHAVENAASCRVAQKGGFGLEQLLPANKKFGDGRVHDEHLHARVAD